MVRLIPKSGKAKQCVKQYGDTGMVLQSRERVLFSDEQGPWLLVSAADPQSRWVHHKFDPDFTVETL